MSAARKLLVIRAVFLIPEHARDVHRIYSKFRMADKIERHVT